MMVQQQQPVMAQPGAQPQAVDPALFQQQMMQQQMMMQQQQMMQQQGGGGGGAPIIINNQQQQQMMQPQQQQQVVMMRQGVKENYCGPYTCLVAIFFWPIVCCPIDTRVVYY